MNLCGGPQIPESAYNVGGMLGTLQFEAQNAPFDERMFGECTNGHLKS
jgi:hypothetical protein